MDDDDESISTLLAMGFPDIGEIKRALRMSKNDLNEAVAILTNEQGSSSSASDVFGPSPRPPSSSDHAGMDEMGGGDVDMKDPGSGGLNSEGDCNGDGFPLTNLYELESRVFQDNWSIPYKREESLGRCLVAATKMAKEGTMNSDEHCLKFLDRVLPEAFRKLLTSNATQRWQMEIQEGIYDMIEMFIDLIIAKMKATEEVQVSLLHILATAFDMKNDWNHKNRDRLSRGRWSDSQGSGDHDFTGQGGDFAQAPRDGYARTNYGWLCDLINFFGDKGGFQLIADCFENQELDARQMSALLAPVANCVEALVKDRVNPFLSKCMDAAFKFVNKLDVADIRGKEITAVSDLLTSMKVLCLQFWPNHVDNCDQLRLGIICKMLKAPQFNSKMNALKEVSRLIDECKQKGRRNISVDQVVEWMAENRVLSVALEGNIDQVQYTDRIRSIVEFLGPRLSNEELTKMWQLQESANAHVVENIYAIMAGAACKFSLHQFEHLTNLIRETWEKSNDRVREKLLILVGQIGKETTQVKSSQAILALLWELSHMSLPKHLMEKALSEHLSILTEITLNRDVTKRMYVLKCVDDIKQGSSNIVPSIKHLHDICKSYSKGTTIYQKADKATLGELNKQHEIVKLLSTSLKSCHAKAVTVAEAAGQKLQKDTLYDERYTHLDVVDTHLSLMQFFLKEGDLYLSWSRCKELWSTLVENPKAIAEDRDKIFNWFSMCLTDLELATQLEFFQSKILVLNPCDITESSFQCFRTFFESINISNGYLRKSIVPPLTVERRELTGLDYLWRIITDSPSEVIANIAINYLLNMCFLYVNAKLKEDCVKLHKEFIASCYSRLEMILSKPVDSENAVHDGHEVETSISSERSASQALMAISISNVSTLPLNVRGQRLQQTTRILNLAERYISTIEEAFPSIRTILPHAATFHGRRLDIKIVTDNKKDELTIESHRNELVGDVKARIAESLKQSLDRLSINCGDLEMNQSKDRCLVGMFAPGDFQTWVVKQNKHVTSSSSTALVLFNDDDKDTTSSLSASALSDASSPNSGDESSRRSQLEEEERGLPGVVMASGGQVFTMLYQLANLSDSKTIQSVRRLLCLIPTDPVVEEVLDAIDYHSSVSNPVAAADASPKMSPRSKKVDFTLTNFVDAQERVSMLFDLKAEGMSPFRVLYNLEVLSARVLPTRATKPRSYFPSSSQEFSTNFLNAGGLRLILGVLNSLPPDIDYDIRQSSYLVALQLADYLLCGQAVGAPVSLRPVTSPVIKPTPPKRSALDSSLSMAKSPVVISATKIVQTMSENEFTDTILCLMRVIWAAAAGNLQLASAGVQSVRHSDHPRFFLGRRSRDSSTGSSSSEGSSVPVVVAGTSSNSEATTLHAGVCAQQTTVSSGDCQIAGDAFELLVTCLQMRSNHISAFYTLPLINEFIIDTVLGSPSEEVRQRSCDQLIRLSRVRLTARCLNLDGGSDGGGAAPLGIVTPRQFLAKLLLKTPVPLWMPSCKARGISHSILSQCSEYFDLRCALLRGLSKREQDTLEVNAAAMVEDELTFLNNFTPCQRRRIDCTLLAGHLRLVEALLSCEGVDKRSVGRRLIPEILASFLFPASQLMSEGSSRNVDVTKDVNPKCDTAHSRVAAYSLLVDLSKGCADNVELIATELIRMHHSFNENLLKEFEYCPAVERRSECNFVGLKNAGATCYMNSVLQQLYCVPGVSDLVLAASLDSADEETIFYQLQNVFGHLQESKLQYYEPEKFWHCFRLFGQPVNVREQQDAFEFFTQIVDQADEFLAKNQKPKIFSSKFEGVFSDQKICHGCPHRYEREETFMALNLTVKTNNLQESLDQFVKGELLEGDNAYYCEKCKAKRNAIKRMCIRTLPSTLVIQLKRFHYDWETNRALKFDDYFQFPWTLDMSPYTTEGIKAKEEGRKSVRLEQQQQQSAASTSVTNSGRRYDLVGVVVHSGQANAGHYYSYIKERGGRPGSTATSSSKPNLESDGGDRGNININGRWFKFNDTSVEPFNMNDDTLSTECFGGTYKVKKDGGNSSSLPENRQRYWNAYMLVYEAVVDGSGSSASSTPGPVSLRSSAKKTQSQSQNRFTYRKPSGPFRTSEPPTAARESLSQLSDLLEKGEKKGLFSSRMPASIERGIQEENLRFLENRDVYCDDYYNFIYEFLVANVHGPNSSKAERYPIICKESVRLGLHFLCNSYFHLRHRQNMVMRDVVDAVSNLMDRDADTTDWVLHFLSSSTDGLQYLRPFLLECPFREVRVHFADVLQHSFLSFEKHNGNTEIDHINRILSTLVGLIENDVPNNCKTSGQFFWLLSKFAQMGVKQSQQLFQMNVFSQVVKFLLGVDADPGTDFDVKKHRRRWSSIQTKEFGELHSALAYLILACNMDSQRDCDVSNCPPPPPSLTFVSENPCPMPATVNLVLHGPIAPLFVKEAVCACREVALGIDAIVGMLVQVSYATSRFTRILLEEVMHQYNTVSSGELKNLSTLLLELLTLEDSLQSERIKFVVEGDETLKIDGLLLVVKNSQSTDSCRAYQCIKTLVNASNKSSVVKEYLLQNSPQWQWSVNWLKSKMTDSGNFGGHWSPSSQHSDGGGVSSTTTSLSTSSNAILSNEDSSTRTFHRTTSAQVTLEEANAILAEFGGGELHAAAAVTVEVNMETEEEERENEVGVKKGDDEEEAEERGEGGNNDDDDDEMPDLQQVQPNDWVPI